MDSRSLPLFPIPISIFNYGEDNHEMNISLVTDILNENQRDTKGQVRSNMGGWHSKSNLEILRLLFQGWENADASINSSIQVIYRIKNYYDDKENENKITFEYLYHFNKLFNKLKLLQEKYNIQIPVWSWESPKGRFIRISAQLYNSEEEYHYLAEALATELKF